MTALTGSIQIKRDTAANWTSANPTLLEGQQGFETNTGRLKIGDGSTAWNSLTYWNEPISGTWSAVKSLKDGGALIPGRRYTITDFATVHTVPNTATTNTGVTEPLTLAATSANTFSHVAYSALFPQDIIYYELVDTSTAGGTKGRIYYRKDALINVATWYDWRNVKFQRWESSAGSLKYTALTDPGSGAGTLLVYTFNSITPNPFANISIGRKTTGDQLNNIVFGDVVNFALSSVHCNVYIDDDCLNCTLGANTSWIKMGIGCANVTIWNQASIAAGAAPKSSTQFGAYCDTILIEGTLLHYSGTTTAAKLRKWIFGNGVNNVTLSSTLVSSAARTNLGFYLGDGMTSLTFSSAHLNANDLSFKKEKGFSSFTKSVAITGLTTFSWSTTMGNEVGDVTLTTTNSSETISSITGTTAGETYILRGQSGKTFTFTNGTLKIAGAANFVLNGTNGDYLVIENRGGVIFCRGVNF